MTFPADLSIGDVMPKRPKPIGCGTCGPCGLQLVGGKEERSAKINGNSG